MSGRHQGRPSDPRRGDNPYFQARARLGLTLAEVGEVVGVSASAVSRWERGLSQPNDDHIPALFALFSESTR